MAFMKRLAAKECYNFQRMENDFSEFFIIVDVETAGPNPSQYALLSIGACTLTKPRESFYIELQPDKDLYDPGAMAVHQLSFPELRTKGSPPQKGMQLFSKWLRRVTPADSQLIFTAFNAPFDWMFVCDYFHRYLGTNPFGYKALDIKAYFMGMKRVSWDQTSHTAISRVYGLAQTFRHHALEDALQEADLFARILADTAPHPPQSIR